MGPKAASAIPEVIALLEDENFEIGNRASECLARLGPAAVKALIKELRSESPIGPIRAGECLRQMGPKAKSAVPELIDIAKDATLDFSTRDGSIWALGRIYRHARKAIAVLIELLGGDDKSLAGSAAGAFGHIGPDAQAAIPELKKALNSDEVSLRRAAAN